MHQLHHRLTLAGQRVAGGARLDWIEAVRAAVLQERERWILWLPVAFGLGIAVYFALPSEPPAWLVPVILLIIALPAFKLCRHVQAAKGKAARGKGPILGAASALGLMALLLGLGIAQLRTHQVEAPVLERRGAYQVEGEILLVEPRIKGERLLVGKLRIDDLPDERTPLLVRFTRRGETPPLRPGDRIEARVMLMPPSAPSEPHGFDFARRAYFERLGAVGYSLKQPVVLSKAEGWSLAQTLASLRQHLAAEIKAAIGGPSGAVATALITGLRGGIPDNVWRDMQAAGMAHLLAISGLHLGLVAGTVFFACRIMLALIPPLALRWPTKKIAAGVALLLAFVYLMLTGATVPTQRAFIMTALMLVAVMVDRNPFSMRLVAWSALLVLASQPESLLGASFQMSFAAVIALIAVYETGVGRMPEGAGGLDWRLLMYVAGVVLTTVIASTATAPLGIYHFGRLPTFSILANVLAVPLTAFWIMPLGLLGMLLLPFGLENWCLVLMGFGIDMMLDIAAWTAAVPGAVIGVPRPPLSSLVLVLLGGLWLALWKTEWRRLGLLPIVIGLVLAAIHRQPDLLIDARGLLVAARIEDGRLALSPWKKDSWVTKGWLRGAGQEEAAPWPEEGEFGSDSLRCDALGCIYQRAGHRVALVRNAEGLPEDCARNDLVIGYPWIETCRNGTPLIGPDELRATGGLAFWFEPGRIRRLSVREVLGDRPWVR